MEGDRGLVGYHDCYVLTFEYGCMVHLGHSKYVFDWVGLILGLGFSRCSFGASLWAQAV